MAFTFRQLFNPDTQGGGGVDSGGEAREKIDRLDDIKDTNEKYSSVNIDTSEDGGTYTFIGDKGDYKLDKARDDKSGYKLEQKEKPKNESQEKPYTKSKEYREYTKDPNRKESKIETDYRLHILDKLLETSEDGGEQNNDTISSSAMPEKKEPPNPRSEKIALSAEDLALQKKVEEEILTSRNILEKEMHEATSEGDKRRQKWVNKKIRDFELYPYGYIQNILERKLEALEGDLENPENKSFIKEIKLRISKVKARIDNLLKAYEKKIPLKLDRNERTKEFRPDEGLVFDSDSMVDILNRYLKENSKAYIVGDAFQKGPAQYVVLKTDTGVEKEINIRKLDEILNDAIYRDEHINKIKKEKIERFEKIKSGSIVQIRTSGFKGKETTYKIHEVKDGKVMYENLNERHRVTVSIEDMRKFLMDKEVEFIVDDKDVNTYKSKDEEKQPNSETYKNLSPNLLKVTEIAKELGFMNASVIQRDLKLSKEDAEKLFSEYQALENPIANVSEVKEPTTQSIDKDMGVVATTEQAKTDDIVTQEPTQEQQGPTSEQIAEFESIMKRREELDAQIKALEKEIQKELEGTQSIVATSLEATNNS